MRKTIAIIGSLDTKGEEFAFLKGEIEKRGCRTFVINTGVLGNSSFPPDVSADEVAAAAGTTINGLAAQGDRGIALDAMTRGVAALCKRLYDEGKFDGIISMGGGGGTAMGCAAMRALPVGVPKLMVSTVASSDVSPHVGTADITMMPSIVDMSGLNRISRKIYINAAGAICGMAAGSADEAAAEKPLIAISMFGNTTRAVDRARKMFEAKGYETLCFSATGTGGKTMERLIAEGYFDGVLDMTTTEWADELCGGVHSAGPSRLEAAAQAGIPQVVVPGCVDMCNFFEAGGIPEKYAGRVFYHWNPNVTLMRTTPEENTRMGEIFADKLNAARGPVSVFIPMKGFSEVGAPGKPFWWPEADEAFVTALKSGLRADIPLRIISCNINAPEFAEGTANALLEMLAGGEKYGP